MSIRNLAGPILTMKRRKPVCSRCGSENVAADAAARWDVEAQHWEVVNVHDDGHGCDDCKSWDVRLKWVEV